jgi:hypothetical protein
LHDSRADLTLPTQRETDRVGIEHEPAHAKGSFFLPIT